MGENANNSKNTRITRRQFLKTGVAGALIPRLPNYLQPPETDQEKIDRAIKRELGLSKEQIQFEILPGNHVLSPNLVDRLRTGEVNVVMGEMTNKDLKVYLTDKLAIPSAPDFGTRLLNPGSGITSAEQNYQSEACRSLLKSGVTLVSVDAPFGALLTDQEQIPSVIPGVLAAGGITFGKLTSIAVKYALQDRLNEKQYNAIAASPPGALIGYYISEVIKQTDPSYIYDPSTFERNPLSELASDMEGLTDRLLKDPVFITIEEGKMDFRNKVMALHAYNTLSRSVVKGQKGVKAALFEGVSHGRVQDEFLRGVDALEDDVEGYARRLLTKSFDYLYDVYLENPRELESVVIRYGEMFSQPDQIGDFPVGAKDLAATRTPKTAFTIFMKQIDRRQAELEEAGDEVSIQKSARLRFVKFSLLRKDAEQNQELRMKESDLLPEKVIHSQPLEFDQYSPLGYWYIFDSFQIVGNSYASLVGSYSYQGYTLAMLRNFWQNEDGETIRTSDVVHLRGDSNSVRDLEEAYKLSDKKPSDLEGEQALFLVDGVLLDPVGLREISASSLNPDSRVYLIGDKSEEDYLGVSTVVIQPQT